MVRGSRSGQRSAMPSLSTLLAIHLSIGSALWLLTEGIYTRKLKRARADRRRFSSASIIAGTIVTIVLWPLFWLYVLVKTVRDLRGAA
jgi:uncharacterized membrane protein YciS (DUF1049 family)